MRRHATAADHLFAGVDLRLAEGSRVGLVGPNGGGKSTLLRLLAGSAAPDEGVVVRAPGTRTALLDQDAGRSLLGSELEPPPSRTGDSALGRTVWQVAAGALVEMRRVEDRLRQLEAELTEQAPQRRAALSAAYDSLLREHERLGGYGATSRLREILAALGFAQQRYDDAVVELSDGERQRLALAEVLASPVDVLLLDEPTNHLDIAARSWLERHLSRKHGAVVLVSHDRMLLDAATDQTAFLGKTGIALVNTSYSRAARTRSATESQQARRMREMEKEAARLEEVAAELAAHGARAQARRRRAARESSELRTRAQLLAPAAQTLNTVRLGPYRRRLASLQSSEGNTEAGHRTLGRRATRGLLLEASHLTVPGLLDDVAVRIEAGERIALLGPNGSGKSTLLALLAGSLAGGDPRQRLWYAPAMKLVSVDQRSRGLRAGVAVVEQGSASLGLEAARNVLAATGLPYAAWSRPPEELSGGERARVGLALALAQPFDLLLLDEPDNDLDLAAVEALESGLVTTLEETGAALVIATHDRRLARAVAGRAWSISDGALAGYGSVAAYLRGGPPVPAAAFWQGSEPAPVEQEPVPDRQPQEQLDLEAERDTILERLTDPLALGDRERERLRHRLLELEGALMSSYDAALAPAAPRYRLVERGLTLYADLVRPADDEPSGAGGDHRDRLLVVAAADAGQAAAELAAAATTLQPGVPWLDVRLIGDVAHMRIGSLPGASLLPTTAQALVDAGTRLAFTVMGARGAQLFSPDALGPTMLSSVGDDWWYVELERFLALEGWSVHDGPDERTGTAGHGRSRRRRRGKVVGQ